MISLIHDEDAISRFQEICKSSLGQTSMKLPALIVNLSFRLKYFDDPRLTQSHNNFFIRRLFINNSDLISLIRRLEVAEGVYTHELKDKSRIPMDPAGLSVYMTLNPRSQLKSLLGLTNSLSLQMADDHLYSNAKLDSQFLTFLHKSPQTKVFVDIDIDTKDHKFISKVLKDTPDLKNHEFAIETRGGYHLIFKPNLIPKEFWKFVKSEENKFTKKSRDGTELRQSYFDIRSDVTLPIPGTIQGGFAVRFVDDFCDYVFSQVQ